MSHDGTISRMESRCAKLIASRIDLPELSITFQIVLILRCTVLCYILDSLLQWNPSSPHNVLCQTAMTMDELSCIGCGKSFSTQKKLSSHGPRCQAKKEVTTNIHKRQYDLEQNKKGKCAHRRPDTLEVCTQDAPPMETQDVPMEDMYQVFVHFYQMKAVLRRSTV